MNAKTARGTIGMEIHDLVQRTLEIDADAARRKVGLNREITQRNAMLGVVKLMAKRAHVHAKQAPMNNRRPWTRTRWMSGFMLIDAEDWSTELFALTLSTGRTPAEVAKRLASLYEPRTSYPDIVVDATNPLRPTIHFTNPAT
jgi:hypothetical protein